MEVKKETDVKYVHYGDIHTNIADEIDKNNNLPFINEIYKEYDELKLDDVIVADASEDYKGIADAAVIISNLPYTIIAGLHTIALRPTSLIKGYFLYHIFKTENFKRFGYKIGTGLKVFGISYNNLAKYKVYYPQEIEEQEKIIGILSNLTNSINLHERKCEELALIKKALLQKLFPKKDEFKPEVRYKNFSDAWEQRKLGEVVERFDNLRIPVTSSKREKGITPYYGANGIQDYVQGYTHDGEFVLVAEDGANDLQNYPVHYVNGKVWVNNHAHVLQGKNKMVDNLFLVNAIKQIKIETYLVGGSRAKLNADVMMKLPIKVPTFNEQQKIGEYFSKFDTLITLHQRKLEKLKQLKKFLLQNMFI
ncbi:restriction endonuclease subunit S [Ligilactobacillus salivarius]|uniref:restriction endonuclease subunit S n=1 Tax=Ligilactobacillus salivarius TaxID=1624 RepID=UPI0029585CC2|nr:restriction endonuclease subunit S [Ligilactobacillus salivarius]